MSVGVLKSGVIFRHGAIFDISECLIVGAQIKAVNGRHGSVLLGSVLPVAIMAIETMGEYEALRSLGVRYIQGYLLARPGFKVLPEAALPEETMTPVAQAASRSRLR